MTKKEGIPEIDGWETSEVGARTDTDAYEHFIGDLRTAFGLYRLGPESIDWVDVKERDLDPPEVVVTTVKDSPRLAVNLYPQDEEGTVTSTKTPYQAPLSVVKHGIWGESDLRNYMLTHAGGMPEHKAQFAKDVPLVEYLDGGSMDIFDSTPVVEVMAFLPVSSDGIYRTEFCPEVSFGPRDHSLYRISTVAQDGINRYFFLTRGGRTEIKDVGEDLGKHNWQSDALADLTAFEQFIEPSTAGHMVFIADPVEEKQSPHDILGSGGGFNYGNPGSFDSIFRQIRTGASVGKARVSRGSRTGQGGLFDGELIHSTKGNQVIYHMCVLGVTRKDVESTNERTLDRLRRGTDTYPRA